MGVFTYLFGCLGAVLLVAINLLALAMASKGSPLCIVLLIFEAFVVVLG
jgi:hypothetical protein